jgi:hypothetical protein
MAEQTIGGAALRVGRMAHRRSQPMLHDEMTEK